MTGVAVLKVDDVGRRPLLIGGVGGIVCIFHNCTLQSFGTTFTSENLCY